MCFALKLASTIITEYKKHKSLLKMWTLNRNFKKDPVPACVLGLILLGGLWSFATEGINTKLGPESTSRNVRQFSCECEGDRADARIDKIDTENMKGTTTCGVQAFQRLVCFNCFKTWHPFAMSASKSGSFLCFQRVWGSNMFN